MPPTSYGRCLVTMAAVVIVAASANAQQVTSDPSASDVAKLLRGRGGSGQALAVRTQARGNQSKQRRDEIADTLASIAIGFPGKDKRASSTRAAAVTTLVNAGAGRTGNKGARGVPYDGAVDRLMRIAEAGQSVGTRAAALWGLTQVPTSGRVLPFLRKMATSEDRIAYRAIILLAESSGSEGLALARSLYASNTVTEPTAVETLNHYAKANQWPCPTGKRSCG